MSDLELSFQMTKPAPLVWAHVITPRPARKINGETIAPSFEATFLLPADHPDLAAIKAMLSKAATGFDKFADKIAGNKAAGRAALDGIKFPLESGTKIADQAKAKGKDREFLRGTAMLKGKSNVTKRDGTPLSPPRLVVLQGGKYVRYSDDHERELAKKFFYSGVLAIGTFNFAPYPGMGGGISAYLNEILSLNAGEKINTGVDDEAKYGDPNAFSGYVGKVSAEDPTGGLDDEIPF
jgi:hypothetical protein